MSTYYLPGILLSAENKVFGKPGKSCCFIELKEINKYVLCHKMLDPRRNIKVGKKDRERWGRAGVKSIKKIGKISLRR